jgi:hypothetical protein
MQSVLRADAKPFISAALRRLFSATPQQPGGAGLAFLAAPHDLAWDVPMSKVGYVCSCCSVCSVQQRTALTHCMQHLRIWPGTCP